MKIFKKKKKSENPSHSSSLAKARAFQKRSNLPTKQDHEDDRFFDIKNESIVDRIRGKVKDGDVDLNHNAEIGKSKYDERNEELTEEQVYDEEDALEEMTQPEDSNLKGDDLEEGRDKDMVSRIRKKMRKKQ